MAYSKEELMQEMLRREATRRGVDIGGGATPVPGNPQGPSAAEFTQGLSSSRPEGGEWHDEPRAALRGLTMGASDAVGSAIAAVPASFGSDKGIGEVYKDIRGTTQMQEDDYAAANPGLKQALEVGGTVAGAGDHSQNVVGSHPVEALQIGKHERRTALLLLSVGEGKRHNDYVVPVKGHGTRHRPLWMTTRPRFLPKRACR